MSFEPIKRILVRSIQSTPVASRQIQIARVFEAWRVVLLATWGEQKASYISVVSFKEGTLKVESRSPSAKQQLMIDLPRIKNEVNRQMGDLVLRSIVVISKGF